MEGTLVQCLCYKLHPHEEVLPHSHFMFSLGTYVSMLINTNKLETMLWVVLYSYLRCSKGAENKHFLWLAFSSQHVLSLVSVKVTQQLFQHRVVEFLVQLDMMSSPTSHRLPRQHEVQEDLVDQCPHDLLSLH